jgi:hypothetical protein
MGWWIWLGRLTAKRGIVDRKFRSY